MGYLSEKIAYLKGLADGLEIGNDTKEGKLLSAIVEVLDEMALEVDDMVIIQEDMQEQLDDVDTALAELEDDFYELDDDIDDDEDFDPQEYMNLFDEDDELEDSEDEYEESFGIECPKCGDMIYLDADIIECMEGKIECPNCGEPIMLEFDVDGMDWEDTEEY